MYRLIEVVLRLTFMVNFDSYLHRLGLNSDLRLQRFPLECVVIVMIRAPFSSASC